MDLADSLFWDNGLGAALLAASSASVTVAAPNRPMLFVMGGVGSAMPFNGGSSWPKPPLIISSWIPTDGAGSLVLTGTWPAGAPSGATLVFQVWFEDTGATFLWAASNGLFATSP